MTIDVEAPKDNADNFESLGYSIDLTRAEREGRPLGLMLVSRRCPKCCTRLKSGIPTPLADEQIKEIAGCCGKHKDFLKPEMPLRELAFRLIIRGGNKATPLTDLHYALTEDWAFPTHPMNISVRALKKILDSDRYYCFQEVRGRTRRSKRR